MASPRIKSAVYQEGTAIVNLLVSCYNQHMETTNQIENSFQKTFGSAPAHIVRAPGRVNLLGEHVDYNDGFVLPAAIDRATFIAFSASGTELSTLVATDMKQEVSFSPQTIPAKAQADGSPLPEWAHYPA